MGHGRCRRNISPNDLNVRSRSPMDHGYDKFVPVALVEEDAFVKGNLALATASKIVCVVRLLGLYATISRTKRCVRASSRSSSCRNCRILRSSVSRSLVATVSSTLSRRLTSEEITCPSDVLVSRRVSSLSASRLLHGCPLRIAAVVDDFIGSGSGAPSSATVSSGAGDGRIKPPSSRLPWSSSHHDRDIQQHGFFLSTSIQHHEPVLSQCRMRPGLREQARCNLSDLILFANDRFVQPICVYDRPMNNPLSTCVPFSQSTSKVARSG